jgi:Domain of unknown function (DUF4262)
MSTPQRIARDDPERIVLHNIAEFGWHCVNVIEDDGQPPWTFSIGFYETYGFPEIIIIGRSRATSHHILETLSNTLEKNESPDLTAPALDLIPGIPCLFQDVLPRYFSDYVGFALWFYRKRKFPLFQIVWPNNEGLYPWSPRASKAFKEWQPVLSGSFPTCAKCPNSAQESDL